MLLTIIAHYCGQMFTLMCTIIPRCCGQFTLACIRRRADNRNCIHTRSLSK